MTAEVRGLVRFWREDADGVKRRYWSFNIAGSHADFYDGLEAFKEAVPPRSREWNPKEKVWTVADGYEDELEAIFGNFAGLREEIEMQLELPF